MGTQLSSNSQNYLISLTNKGITPRGVDVITTHHEVLDVSTNGYDFVGVTTSNLYSNLAYWWPMIGTGSVAHGLNLLNTASYSITWNGNPTFSDGYTSFGTSSAYGSVTTVANQLPTSVTFTWWANAYSLPNATYGYAGMFGWDGGVGSAYFCTALLYTSGVTLWFVGSTTPGTNVSITGTHTITANTWYHYALAWNGATGTATVYVNGISDGTGTNVSVAPFTSTGLFEFGYDVNGGTLVRFFTGAITDCMVFNKVLTQAQILNIYNNQALSRGI